MTRKSIAPKMDANKATKLPPAPYRSAQTFSYDTTRYPFQEILVEIFQLYLDLKAHRDKLAPLRNVNEDIGKVLSSLHHVAPAIAENIRSRSSNRAQTRRGTVFNGAYHRILRSSVGDLPDDLAESVLVLRRKFDELLHKFIGEVVGPLLGAERRAVAYQGSPTLRVSFPSSTPMGRPHRDYDYLHQPSEVNFWIPLTRTWGSNSLHCESVPGRGDYSPFVLEYGQGMRFWGNQCHHYCEANSTDSTRVSLDMRCLLLDWFDNDFVDHKGQPGRFRIGEYYRVYKDEANEKILEDNTR